MELSCSMPLIDQSEEAVVLGHLALFGVGEVGKEREQEVGAGVGQR
jgi:hypothetical protein